MITFANFEFILAIRDPKLAIFEEVKNIPYIFTHFEWRI